MVKTQKQLVTGACHLAWVFTICLVPRIAAVAPPTRHIRVLDKNQEGGGKGRRGTCHRPLLKQACPGPTRRLALVLLVALAARKAKKYRPELGASPGRHRWLLWWGRQARQLLWLSAASRSDGVCAQLRVAVSFNGLWSAASGQGWCVVWNMRPHAVCTCVCLCKGRLEAVVAAW